MRTLSKVGLFVLICILLSQIVYAIDWSPQGNINLKDRYYITNNPSDQCPAGQYAVGVYTNGSWNCTTVAVSGSYLPLAGGTMGGNIDMGTNSISNIGGVTASGTVSGNILSGQLTWTDLHSYATTCTASQYISALGDTSTCGAISITESQISDFGTYVTENTNVTFEDIIADNLNVTDKLYVGIILSTEGNSIDIQPTGDIDDYFSFKTPAHRPTIKREGGKFIYFTSSNVYDVGISLRDDDTYSGTLNYEKDNHKMTLLGKASPVAIKTNSEYVNYFLFETTDHQPQLSAYNASYLEIKDNLTVIGYVQSSDWTNVSIMESQVSDLQSYRLDSWDNFTGIPTITPANGETTKMSTADQIYDYIVSLNYKTLSQIVADLGNWSSDKGSYWNESSDLDNDEIAEAKIGFSTACGAGNHYYLSGNDLACEANTVDTNANTICSGTTTYLDGDGGCDDISNVYVNDGCTNCLNAQEIEDIYVLNSGDTMTGDLLVNSDNIDLGVDASAMDRNLTIWTENGYTSYLKFLESSTHGMGFSYNATANTLYLDRYVDGQVNLASIDRDTGKLNYDSGTFYIDASSNEVGIGTDSPDAKLHVAYSGSGNVIFQHEAEGGSSDLDLKFGHNNYGWYWRYEGSGSGDNNKLALWSEGAGGVDDQVYGIYQSGNIKFYKTFSLNTGTSVTDIDITVANNDNALITSGGVFDGLATKQPLEATLTDIADGSIAENLVNTANPWDISTETNLAVGNGITLTDDTLTVVGGTAITADAGGVSVTADSISDTQLAYNTGQHLTATSTPDFNGINATYGNVTEVTCIRLACGLKIGDC